MHFILGPLALVFSAVEPAVNAPPFDPIGDEVSLESGAVSPYELALAVLPPKPVFSLVIGSVFPLLDAEAVLLIVEPLPLISGP